jgi:hypothetical protein
MLELEELSQFCLRHLAEQWVTSLLFKIVSSR